MNKLIEIILEFNIVSYLIIASVFIVLLLLIATIIFILKKKKFISILKKAISEDINLIMNKYTKDYLIKKSKLIIKTLKEIDKKRARDFLYGVSLANTWVKALNQYADHQYFKGILTFEIEEGFFLCFKYALISEKLKKEFLEWLKRDDSYLKKIAYYCNGADFNGNRALKILDNYISLIKEMIIYNDWKYRFFSLIILVNLKEPATEKMLFELFKDPDFIIRQTLIKKFNPEDRDKLKDFLFMTIISDPNPQVRFEAIKRFHQEYDDFPETDIQNLKSEEILHLIEALRKDNRRDESIATELVLHDNPEISYAASHFLDRAGVLSRFSKELDLSDSKDWERKRTIFIKSAQAGATSFLQTMIEKNNRENLLMLGEILKQIIIPEILPQFLKKAVNSPDIHIYELALKAISKYCGKDEKEIIIKELTTRINEKEKISLLVESISNLKDMEFIEPLLEILEKYPDMSEQVKDALLTKDEKYLVYRLINTIKNEEKPLQLKIHLYLLLAKLKKDFCLSFLLEHLPIIPVKWMSKIGSLLKEYPEDLLYQKLNYYLNLKDGRIKSNLIALIPNTGLNKFLDKIRDGLYDIDPFVRIASAYALIDLGDKKSIRKAIDLLRDPVDQVREEVAYALARTGDDKILESLKNYIFDENEIDSVKKSILKGLAECHDVKATDLLLDILEKIDYLENDTVDSLKDHTYFNGIVRLIEGLKDSGKETRRKIITVLKKMGVEAKPFLMDILKSDLVRLKESVSEVLDEIGGTDEEIKRLSHNNPQVRREAAENLSLIQTPKAFRGLIIASRDPDREVRIKVIKALEKLETDEGKDILKSLENDPDPKIRKYTHWALERLKAKELV